MKRLFALLTLIALSASLTLAQTQQVKDKAATTTTELSATSGPAMTFEVTEVDYGKIEQESDPYRSFKFTNTGTEPLVIKGARGSCGCTVPTYPKEPILPGETGEIKVRYDTKRIGKFTKTVTLTTNAEVEQYILRIKGEVLRKAPEPEAVPASKPNVFNSGN